MIERAITTDLLIDQIAADAVYSVGAIEQAPRLAGEV